MPDYIGFALFVAAVLIFLGWFFVGTQWNVRKGDTVLKWLREGLPLLGERTTMRWLGSSVVELKIAKAKDPFRNVETLIVFEPRDVLFLWAYYRLRGRRDLIIFRTQLRAVPTYELEAFDPKGWSTSHIERNARGKNWTQLDLSATAHSQFLAYYSGEPTTAPKPLIDLASQTGGKLIRLSIHRSVPNLEVHWLLPDVSSRPTARDMFTKLRQLGEAAMSA
jgi:hypothetical protein